MTINTRKVVIETVEAFARIADDEQVAAGYTAIAAELRGPSDLATATRLLADDYQEAGYVETPDWFRAIADIVEGKFPCGHEPQGPPVDGREVDRAPDWVRRGDLIDPTWTTHADGGSWPTSKTGDGEAVPPVTSPSPHTWLGPDRECFCLIGDDHVSEPRFEKES